MVELSLIIPVFNEEAVIQLLYENLCTLAEKLPVEYEWIFVNDGSQDQTLFLLHNLAQQNSRVKIVNLSRNFGHQIAITAGVDFATGNAVVIMDADLQDPPHVIENMYQLYLQGYDVVYARREHRSGESWLKLKTASCFYLFMRKMVHHQLPQGVGDFRLMSKRVVTAMRYFPERHRFYRGMVTWSGFRQTAVSFSRPARAAGTTKYSWLKMSKFATDAILSFSYLPIRIAILLGMLLILLPLLYFIDNLFLHIFWRATVKGWSSLIGLLIIFQGITIVFIGLLGEYIGRIYEEVKRRPLYIVSDTINLPRMNTEQASGGIIAGALDCPQKE